MNTGLEHSKAAAIPVGEEPILEMEAAFIPSLRNPSRLALENINWQVAPGDYWVVGGLQESGKSDLMAAAAGILPPTRGQVRMFGRALGTGVESEWVAARLRLGLVVNGGGLLRDLTLAENISLPIRYHQNCSGQHCAQRLDALLKFARLSAWAKHHPSQMTRNRLQRGGLARALALSPELLLFDSPLMGLDPQDVRWWLEMLDQLAAGHPLLDHKPVTIIVAGDDLRLWRGRARQFAVLKDRALVSFDSSPEALQNARALCPELFGGNSDSQWNDAATSNPSPD